MAISEKIYKKKCIHRYEELPYLGYIKYTDFPNFKYEKYEFMSKGYKLVGGFYYYDNYKSDRLVIFCHGIGGGYSSYMSEIEMLARGGFKVLAFDYIGCCNSEGKDTISMLESIVNLDACLNSLNNMYDDRMISVVGHSWGGFAASNILRFHPNLHSIVDISGFISIKHMALNFVSGPLAVLRRGILNYELKMNPSYFDSSSLDTLANTKAKVLVIHDEDDNMVKYELSAKLLKEKINNPNVKFLITKGKYHNPQYTYDACKYMNETFGRFNKLCKNKEIKTLDEKKAYFKDIDWKRMTNQDEDIYKYIYDALN